MTDSSSPDPPDPPAPSVQEDHTQVFALLNSAEMQKRLQEARVRRAKILEAQKSGSADLSELRSLSSTVSAVGSGGWGEPGSTLPANAALKQPVGDKSHRRSQVYNLVIGLLSGLALGLGLMWYSGLTFLGPSSGLDVAGTPAQEDLLASTVDGEDAEEIAVNEFDVDPAPPAQPIPAEPVQTDRSFNLPRADQSPIKPEFGAFEVPPDSDRLTLKTASSAEPAGADQPLALLPLNPVTQDQLAIMTEESPPVSHDEVPPVLDAAQATDRPPSMPIELTVPHHAGGQVDIDLNSATALASVPLLVALHLSPGLSQEELDDAKLTITTAGGQLASTSVASFGVFQSEVRFFHQADAPSATRMAAEMRIKVRDYSAYRPAPVSGTLEIWFAHEG